VKKLAAVFVLVVLAPALVLAWLATRSLRDQELVVHGQRALLHQASTDTLATEANLFFDEIRAFYGRLVEELLDEHGTEALAGNFDASLRSRWSQVSVGAALTDGGLWMSPAPDTADPAQRRFLQRNNAFLRGIEPGGEIYFAPTLVHNVIAAGPPPLPGSPSGPEALDALSPPAVEPGTTSRLRLGESSAGAEGAEGEGGSAAGAAPIAVAAPASTDPFQAQQKVAPGEDGLRSRAGFSQRFPSSDSSSARPEIAAETAVPDAEESKSEGRPADSSPESPSRATQSPAAPFIATESSFSFAEPEPEPESPVANRNVRPFAQIGHGESTASTQRLARAAEEALFENRARHPWSQIGASAAPLHEGMGDRPEGAVSRLVEGELEILLWRKDPAAPGTVFWAQLDLEEIKGDLATLLHASASRLGGQGEVCFALLDEAGEPVARTVADFVTEWRRPFVASEVGAVLPRWEIAAYLLDPAAAARSARAAQTALWMLVPLLLVAIGFGGALILREIGREMRLARQKTDFVGNVSHELKTPLTSIRMFSELLAAEGEPTPEKRREYTGIVARESARLGRLIDQLLDFSHAERGERRYRRERLPLREWLAETLAAPRQRLEEEGFRFAFDPDGAETEALVVEGDRDALAQVLLNLLSNAEKYGGPAREIEVRLQRSGPRHAEIAVLDRGPGVPRGHAKKIFEKFHRVDDSLASGIEGSGLGLTLARQIARAHGGELLHRPRPGGGSRFVLRLPVLE